MNFHEALLAVPSDRSDADDFARAQAWRASLPSKCLGAPTSSSASSFTTLEGRTSPTALAALPVASVAPRRCVIISAMAPVELVDATMLYPTRPRRLLTRTSSANWVTSRNLWVMMTMLIHPRAAIARSRSMQDFIQPPGCGKAPRWARSRMTILVFEVKLFEDFDLLLLHLPKATMTVASRSILNGIRVSEDAARLALCGPIDEER